MTFIAGCECRDGVALCADSLETDGFVKRHVDKLREYGVADEWGVAIAGAGESGIVDKFWSKLKDVLGNESYDRHKTEAIIERTLKYIREQHPKSDFQFLVAMYSNPNCEHWLYRTEGDCLAPKSRYCFSGNDSTLANFIVTIL